MRFTEGLHILIINFCLLYISIGCTENINKNFTFQLIKSNTPFKDYNYLKRKLELSNVGNTSYIFGNTSVLNYYYVNLYIGNPPKRQALITDTGSHLTAVPCEPLCYKCGKHINSYYNLNGNSSLYLATNSSEIIQCESDECKQFSISKCGQEKRCEFTAVRT